MLTFFAGKNRTWTSYDSIKITNLNNFFLSLVKNLSCALIKYAETLLSILIHPEKIILSLICRIFERKPSVF
jgi:hypothetical protein